jgi:hypothetical protein
MTKTEKEYYKNKKPIGVKGTSNFGGIAVKDFINGINDYVVFEGELGDLHKVKINYTASGEPYFNYRGCREKLDDYMRV